MSRILSAPPIEPTLANVAGWLDELAVATGEGAFARAAAALRQQPPGRPAVDDRLLLAEVDMLIDEGVPQREALLRTARTVCGRQSERAVYVRLARKLKNLRTK